ncbi:hypothetical protein CIB48_g8904 [Xylaria polymorpha]|nr:hypothetical protein CIB48_g8904 [Xylaria polymorpha]
MEPADLQVGHSAKPHEITIEFEIKIKTVAPILLDDYWKRVGGRARDRVARGRPRKRVLPGSFELRDGVLLAQDDR